MKTVLLYQSVPDVTMEQMMEVFPQHEAVEKKFTNAGKILGTGPFAIPGEGAMAIFTDKESAEQFAQQDPFIQHNLYSVTFIKEWYDELGDK